MSSSKRKLKTGIRVVEETDKTKVDKRRKNTNKFCKTQKCKLIKDCWKGKVAAIAYCDDFL
jgi:lipoate synthase